MECSICLGDDPNHKLDCAHQIDEECLQKLLISNLAKKCPMCRHDLDYIKYCNQFNLNNCDICNQMIDVDSINFVKNTNCGCIYHFNCFRQNLINCGITDNRAFVNCPSCLNYFNRETLETKSFTMFRDALFGWIGTAPICRHINKNGIRCNNYCSPRKYYLCDEHCNKNQVRSNESYEMGLTYIFKFGSSLPEDLRLKYFCKIIEDWDNNVNGIKNKNREDYQFTNLPNIL